jgi:23S rRNA pseudouridine955/2504/2580 synthase
MHNLVVSADIDSFRLDKFLCKKFDISFSLAQKLIREKKVKVNGNRVNFSHKIKEGDQIEIFTDLKSRYFKDNKKTISNNKIENFWKNIIFENENFIIINKPSGLATQGGSGVNISVDDFISLKNYQLVHRLDKDTSGILLIAKNSVIADYLNSAFKNKQVAKTYLALVYGELKKDSGIINIPIIKKNLGKNDRVLPDFVDGKEAITNYKVLNVFKNYSLLELKPITGRTHQLRVHCKEIGHPIINDIKYGGKKVINNNLSNRLCLHAYEIEFTDIDGKKIKAKTELPEFCCNSHNKSNL